jgi:hypothetical protein
LKSAGFSGAALMALLTSCVREDDKYVNALTLAPNGSTTGTTTTGITTGTATGTTTGSTIGTATGTTGGTTSANSSIITMEKSSLNIVCPEGVIDGCLFTKEKRQELYGRVAGGRGSRNPEEYQKKQIVLGTGRPCNKTNIRINWRKNEMIENAQPMRKEDGFDYTENFDGKQVFGANTVWVNLKSVVGTGGSQTRTLRDECYKFVDAQLNYLLESKKTDCFFANIFDGDEASSNMKMFYYLLGLPEFSTIKKYIYVGDLKGYFTWLKINVS